ncbi:MAG: hypothetical protein CL933_26590 [Deltaproteobacteria bacterium]|nr:hypothetical protein [Deltaproteobacteria bacterium]
MAERSGSWICGDRFAQAKRGFTAMQVEGNWVAVAPDIRSGEEYSGVSNPNPTPNPRERRIRAGLAAIAGIAWLGMGV